MITEELFIMNSGYTNSALILNDTIAQILQNKYLRVKNKTDTCTIFELGHKLINHPLINVWIEKYFFLGIFYVELDISL